MNLRTLVTRPRRQLLIAGLFTSLLAWACIYVLPKEPRNLLVETTVWSLVLLTSFAGWGSLVRFAVARDEQVDAGLRITWGASLVCAIGGLLMVPSLMTRDAALILVDVGLALTVGSLFLERAKVATRVTLFVRFVRTERRFAVLLAIAFMFLAVLCLGAVADNHTNPYDDEIAYLAFVRKMLDTGTVLEPFSFRRLSALGGQTLFIGLVWLRAGAERSNAFDRFICVVMIVMLVAGFRMKGGRRPPLLIMLAALAMLLTLPLRAINTASYYSGAAFFFGLFRTLLWASARDGRKPWATAVPLALVATTACTLRQNYLPIPVVVLVVSYAARLWTLPAARRATVVELAWSTLLGTLCIAPWLVQSWQSNHTFLYPFMTGTFNPALALKASDPSLIKELKLQMGVFLEGIPIRTLGLFVLGAVFVRERDPRRPLAAIGIGSYVGFVLVCHAFGQSDMMSIGRYVFASAAATVLAVLLVATTRDGREPLLSPIGSTRSIATALVLFATFGQLVVSTLLPKADSLVESYGLTLSNIGMLHRSTATKDTDGAYDRLQGAVPEGARLAVLLDQPFHLSFKRQAIWNLDMPGYSSPVPGIPFFRGVDAAESYFAAQGIRYLAFIQPTHSSYHYRREYWVEMLVDEAELWRSFAPYLIDFLDTLTEMSNRHPHVFEERGMIVLDLGAKLP